MLSKITREEAERITGNYFIDFPESRMKLHWTDWEDTNYILNLCLPRDYSDLDHGNGSILELGTHLGYTTENINNIVRPKKLVTVDIVKEIHNSIPEFQKAELLSRQDSGKMITDKSVRQIKSTTDEFFKVRTQLSKYHQVFDDDKFDAIFIDASHDYEQVLKDSKNALLALNDNGIIIWHDVYNHGGCKCPKCQAEPLNSGVIRALQDLDVQCYKIDHSWIAFHKK